MTHTPQSPLRILVVDDEPGICMLLKEALEIRGTDVEIAHNRRGAIKLLQKQPFDLAFIDLTLPDSTGLDIIREAKEYNPDMAGIIMSGAAVTSFQDLIEYQVDDYLHKPFSLDEITYLIARHKWSHLGGAEVAADFPGALLETAHQIKTPLAVIKEFTHLMLERSGGEISTKQSTYISVINENIDHALTLVRRLEQFQQAAGQLVPPDLEPLNLDALIASVFESWQPVMERHSLHLVSEVADNLAPVLASKPGVEQILYNLLDNATKYAPAGGTIHLRAYGADPQTLCIEVCDEGSGIPADQWDTVFQPYGRLPDHQGSPGLGLGLTIALRIAKQMRGDLVLGDEEGGGTRFILRLMASEPS